MKLKFYKSQSSVCSMHTGLLPPPSVVTFCTLADAGSNAIPSRLALHAGASGAHTPDLGALTIQVRTSSAIAGHDLDLLISSPGDLKGPW
jgi:hypothetical protein